MNARVIRIFGLVLVFFLFSSCLRKPDTPPSPNPNPTPIPPPKTLGISSVDIREFFINNSNPLSVQQMIWKDGNLLIESSHFLDLTSIDSKYQSVIRYEHLSESTIDVSIVRDISNLSDTKPYLKVLLTNAKDKDWSYNVSFQNGEEALAGMLSHASTSVVGHQKSYPKHLNNELHEMDFTWDEKGKLIAYTLKNKTLDKVAHIASRSVTIGYSEYLGAPESVKNIKPGIFWAIAHVYSIPPSLGLHFYNALTNSLIEPDHLPVFIRVTRENKTEEFFYNYTWLSPTKLQVIRFIKDSSSMDRRNRRFIIEFNNLKES